MMETADHRSVGPSPKGATALTLPLVARVDRGLATTAKALRAGFLSVDIGWGPFGKLRLRRTVVAPRITEVPVGGHRDDFVEAVRAASGDRYSPAVEYQRVGRGGAES